MYADTKKADWGSLLLPGSIFLILQSILLIINNDLCILKFNLAIQALLLALFFWWSYQSSGSLFNAPAIFLASLYYWNSIWFLCHYFQVDPLFEYTGRVYNFGAAQIPQAIALISICQSCTIIGILLGYGQQKRNYDREKSITVPETKQSNLSRLVVFFILAAYAALTVVYLFKIGVGFFHEKYTEALYLIQPQDSILYRLYQSTKFFSVIIIITTLAYMKKADQVYIFILLLVLLLVQFTFGSRIVPFMTLITFVVAADHFIKRQTWRTLLIFLVGIAFVSCAVSYARTFVGLGLNVFNLAASKHTVNLWGFIWDAQQGGIVARTIHLIAQRGDIFYGRSIFDSLIYLFPRFIVDGLGFHTGFLAPNDWIVAYSNDIPPGGNLGYSLVAEAYFNFGMMGCLMFLCIGWIIGKNYYRYFFFKDKYALLHALNFSLVLALNMHAIIGTFMRYLIYGVFFIEILRMVDRRRCK